MNIWRENNTVHTSVKFLKSNRRLGGILVTVVFVLVLAIQCTGTGLAMTEYSHDITDAERRFVVCEGLSAPVQISPDDGTATTDTTPTFVWESVEGADSYLLQLDITTTFDSSILINETVSTFLYTPVFPLRFDTWYWRVAANDSTGSLGEFSEIWAVIVEPLPPSWEEVPMDQTVEYGYPLNYDMNATGEYGIHHYWVSDTVHFAIDADGVMTNTTILEVGDYWVEVRAYDPFYHYCDAFIRVIVESAAPPQWVEVPEDQHVEYGDMFYYDLNATDLSGLMAWWINDTALFSIDEHGVIQSLDALEVATYGLKVHVSDILGHVTIGEFNVIVEDTTPPSWVSVPGDRSAFCWIGFTYDLNAQDISGLHTWWVNDTEHFSIDADGIITNTTFLTGGLYGLEVFVNDTYGNVLSAEFTVDVKCCPNPPITIDGDEDFALQGWPGSGTLEDPYVIADQVINRMFRQYIT